MSAPTGGAAWGATAGTVAALCRGRGPVLIERVPPMGWRAAPGGAASGFLLWQVRYRAARSPHPRHAANRCTPSGGRMHLGAGTMLRNDRVTADFPVVVRRIRAAAGLRQVGPKSA